MLRIDDARSQEEDHQILQKQELLALDTQAQEALSASNPDGEDADDFAALKARAWGQMVPGQVQQHLAGLRHQAEQLQHAHKAPQARPSRILHYHCNHLGTPRELTDEDGKLVWSASYWAWGKLRNPKGRSGGAGTDIASPDAPRNQFWHTRTQPGRSNHLPEWVADNAGNLKRWRELKDAEEPQNTPEAANDPSVWGEPTDQSIRFQGQWHDPETGLHYNRFRYYDPDVGRFIHQDPIGLLGGNNLYQYAPNPTAWVDVFGLQRRRKNDPAPKTDHAPNCCCRQKFAYRVLRDEENILDGIRSKAPDANYSIEGHILHGSKISTQYISASATLTQAIENSKIYGTGKERIARIDLSQTVDSVELNSNCSPLKGKTARNRAAKSGEIVIIGPIPPSAITLVR